MTDLIAERKKKLEAIRLAGVNPYPYSYKQTHHAKDILEANKKLKAQSHTKQKVSVAGRIVLQRKMGKASFAHIQDQTGRIQIYVKQDITGKKNYDLWRLIELADIIGVEGTVFATKSGEVTIEAKKVVLLSKALRPLPEKYHGLKDTEIRYRKRHLDLTTNPEVREAFVLRSKIISAFRSFLDEKGFLEVETPTLQPIYGGARARPFKTYHNTLKQDLYLRISDELYLKRLVIGGFEKVYEMCKDFRNEGVDTSHNPEFTMLEWYEAHTDYKHAMKMFEELVASTAKKVLGTTKIKYGEHNINVKAPWKRLRMVDAIKQYTKVDVEKMSEKDLRTELKKRKIPVKKDDSKGIMIQALFEETCEEHLIQPTFIIDHPTESTPLCKTLRNGDETFIERFEPYIAGMEMGNAYSELNDPVKQRDFMERQAKRLKEGDDEAHPMDEDFLEAVEHGMPTMSGVGVGVDRIIMILTGQESIRDVIFFPAMRPEE